MPDAEADAERRTSLRVDGVFRVRVKGADADPVLRPGNISPTGIFFETSHNPGAPGTLHTLDLATEDNSLRVAVLAVVVRVSTVQDLWTGTRVTGAAFQFMPTAETTRRDVENILGHTRARAGSGNVPRLLSLSLESTHPMELGDTVDVELRSTRWAGPIHVHGTVTASQPVDNHHRVTLSAEAPPAEQEERKTFSFTVGETGTLADALSAFVESEQAAPEPRTLTMERAHLGGMLSQVRLQSILGFFAMERMSGVLTIKREGITAHVYLREGAVVDAESKEFPFDARTLLVDMVQWTDGEFQVALQPVDRPDRVGTPTLGLLLDITRQMDERTGKSSDDDEFADFLK